MNQYTPFLPDVSLDQVVERIGWTLLHSVWQFTLLGLLLVVVERLLSRQAATMKYLVAAVVLCLMAGASVTTFLVSGNRDAGQHMADVPAVDDRVIAGTNPSAGSVAPRESDGSRTASTHRQDAVAATAGDGHSANADRIGASNPHPAVAAPSRSVAGRLADGVRPWLPLFVSGWLIGATAASLRLVAGAFHVHRLRSRGRSSVPEHVRQLLTVTAGRLGIRRTIEIAQSSLVPSPLVIGWLKPLILLPATSLTGLTTEQLAAVLAHELAHIRRFDYLVNLLQTIVESVCFYHPAVWWVSHRMRIHREDCCDDRAVSVAATPLAYASALLKLYELQCGTRDEFGVAASSVVISATGGSLTKRIHRVLGLDDGTQSAPLWWCSLAVVGGIVLVTGCGLLADDAQAEREQEQQRRADILTKAAQLPLPQPDQSTGRLPPAKTPEEREQVLQQLEELELSRLRVFNISPNQGPGVEPMTAELWDVPDKAWPLIGRLDSINRVSMTACQTSPEAFRHIAGLRFLRQIAVANSRFEPEHLAALATLDLLTDIDVMLTVFHSDFDRRAALGELTADEQRRFDEIAGPDLRKEHIAEAVILTDRTLVKFDRLKQLRSLRLVNTFVSNYGIQALAGMQELRSVELALGEDIAPETARLFGSLPHLEELELVGQIEANAAFGLRTAPKLKRLELRSIDDAVVKVIAEIPTLEWLRLWASSLSDDGLLELAKLPKLKHVDLRNGFGGTVTLAGIQRFQAACPKCEVLHDLHVETLAERSIPLPKDHFLIGLHWQKAATREQLADEMQKRFADSGHWVEFRPMTRTGFIGGIALVKSEAGRDWLVQQLRDAGGFDIRFSEPLTYERLKTEGVMFEALLKPLQDKAREFDAKRRADREQSSKPDGPAASEPETNQAAASRFPLLEEVMAKLREQSEDRAAEALSTRFELLKQQLDRSPRGVIAYGQVIAPAGMSPQLCDAQMTIHDSGWFVDIIGDVNRPVGFRMFGCRPVDIIASQLQPDVRPGQTMSLGRIVMEPYPETELATVRGQLKFAVDPPPQGIRARIIIRSGPTNSYSGGTDGFLEWPEKENLTLSDDLQFEHRQLAPLPHRIQIEVPGFQTVVREIEPAAGGTLDVGTIEVTRSIVMRVELLASETRDFSGALRRELSVPLQTVWKSFPDNPRLAGYSGGDMRFELRPVNYRDPDTEMRLHLSSGVASLKLSDLGDGPLDDFVSLAGQPAEPAMKADRNVHITSGHVYLTYHTHWKHWTLLRVTIDE